LGVCTRSATAKALEYNLRRWEALTRFVDDGNLPVDNNHLEGQIRPIVVGKHNWLFASSCAQASVLPL
jgi:transposase